MPLSWREWSQSKDSGAEFKHCGRFSCQSPWPKIKPRYSRKSAASAWWLGSPRWLVHLSDTHLCFSLEKGPAQEPALWDSSLSCHLGSWFKSWLLHFWFNVLLMCLGRKKKMAHVLGPLHPHRRDHDGAPGSWIQSGSYLGVMAIWGNESVNERSLSFLLSLLLCFLNK